MLLNVKEFHLENYREELFANGHDATSHQICNEVINMNIFNSVFVDCTANNEIAGLYQSLLENNVSVVTANKIAASSSYDKYETEEY